MPRHAKRNIFLNASHIRVTLSKLDNLCIYVNVLWNICIGQCRSVCGPHTLLGTVGNSRTEWHLLSGISPVCKSTFTIGTKHITAWGPGPMCKGSHSPHGVLPPDLPIFTQTTAISYPHLTCSFQWLCPTLTLISPLPWLKGIRQPCQPRIISTRA